LGALREAAEQGDCFIQNEHQRVLSWRGKSAVKKSASSAGPMHSYGQADVSADEDGQPQESRDMRKMKGR
jgi:hypothetical protein